MALMTFVRVKIRCDAHHDKLSSFIKSNIYMASAKMYILYIDNHIHEQLS